MGLYVIMLTPRCTLPLGSRAVRAWFQPDVLLCCVAAAEELNRQFVQGIQSVLSAADLPARLQQLMRELPSTAAGAGGGGASAGSSQSQPAGEWKSRWLWQWSVQGWVWV
jgi:hypothetical protein